MLSNCYILGHVERRRPAAWNQQDSPRKFTDKRQQNFGRYSSEMHRYVDEMLLTNRLFGLH